MDKEIRFETPAGYKQESFEQIYQALTIKEYGSLSQTGIYGQYNTGDAAIEFILYKGEDNKIGIVFKNIVVKDGKFEDEIKMICISGNEKDYLKNYAHFIIISKSARFIKILETGGEQLKPGIDFRYIQKGTILPSPKLTIILQQGDVTRCTVEEESLGRAKTFKIKILGNPQEEYSEDSKASNQNDKDKNLEKGKQLPSLFEDEIKECRIKEILKKYFEVKEQEQKCESEREKINYTVFDREDSKLDPEKTR